MDLDVPSRLRTAIAHHLRQQGLTVHESAEQLVVLIGGHDLGITCSVYSRQERPDIVMVEIEVPVELSPPQSGCVVQHHVGMERDEPAALAQAVHGWLDGVWPVIAALYDPKAAPGISPAMGLSTVTGQEPPVTWRILVGDPQVRSQKDQSAAIHALLKERGPLTYMVNAMADAVNKNRLLLDGTPNWGHLFASRLNREPGSHEATIRASRWTPSVYLLLRPDTRVARTGPFNDGAIARRPFDAAA